MLIPPPGSSKLKSRAPPIQPFEGYKFMTQSTTTRTINDGTLTCTQPPQIVHNETLWKGENARGDFSKPVPGGRVIMRARHDPRHSGLPLTSASAKVRLVHWFWAFSSVFAYFEVAQPISAILPTAINNMSNSSNDELSS